MGPSGSSSPRGQPQTGYRNRLAERLRRGAFAVTVESPPPVGSKPLEQVLAEVLGLARWLERDGRVDALTVSDRVRTDRDHDPVLAAAQVVEATGSVPLVHWAGKGRTVRDLEADLERARSWGLSSFLLLTGDALREPAPAGADRYLDSVDALRIARQRLPDSLLAAAVNPFKYREEALWGQYVKAAKKLRAGADFLMTQIGWDPRKLAEVVRWLRARGFGAPVLATVWLLTPRVAARLLQGASLPGVYVPPDLLRCLESEAQSADHGRRQAIRRAALQVVGAMRLGLSGAHLCGVHTPRTLEELLQTVEDLAKACPDLATWQAAWEEAMQHPDGRPVQLTPEGAYYLDGPPEGGASPSASELRGFRFLGAVDRWVFDPASPASQALAGVLRRVDPAGPVGRLLRRAEGAIKGPWLGCQLCGTCRLPHTFFVCPETCPKGLANGPCGGTDGNTCEFGDRECIHARIYRLARYTGELEAWESTWVAPVPDAARGQCSWLLHYRGHGARTEVLPAASSPSSAGEPELSEVAT